MNGTMGMVYGVEIEMSVFIFVMCRSYNTCLYYNYDTFGDNGEVHFSPPSS